MRIRAKNQAISCRAYSLTHYSDFALFMDFIDCGFEAFGSTFHLSFFASAHDTSLRIRIIK
jgi:hypothetical protein